MNNLNPLYEFRNPGEKSGSRMRNLKAWILKQTRKGHDAYVAGIPVAAGIATIGAPATFGLLPGAVPLAMASSAGLVDNGLQSSKQGKNIRQKISNGYRSIKERIPWTTKINSDDGLVEKGIKKTGSAIDTALQMGSPNVRARVYRKMIHKRKVPKTI